MPGSFTGQCIKSHHGNPEKLYQEVGRQQGGELLVTKQQ
jgi:hypothetical protein